MKHKTNHLTANESSTIQNFKQCYNIHTLIKTNLTLEKVYGFDGENKSFFTFPNVSAVTCDCVLVFK